MAIVVAIYIVAKGTKDTELQRDTEKTMLKCNSCRSRLPLSAVFDEIQLHQQFTEYFHNEYRCSNCKDTMDTRK